MYLLLSVVYAAPAVKPAPVMAPNALEAAFDAAADEFDVPEPVLKAIAWEATRFDPDAVSEWGGWGMFDLREGDTDPSLEHAAALLEMDPNVVATDWRQSVRGAAALLADQGRLVHGGTLPPSTDLTAWWDAVRAFSGREEPSLQDMYARTIFEVVHDGAATDTRWGRVAIEPQPFDLDDLGSMWAPPPTSCDYSGCAQYVAASTSNYSDYSRTSGDIDMIVIHTVEGSYSGCYAWFQNPDAEASAHYVVRSSDGQVTQMVKEADVAWHAGNWDYNYRSVGIEHEGYTTDCSYYTDALYAGSAALVLDIAARQGVSLDRSHIIGHSEVPDPYNPGEYGGAGHHTDPGSCWDWDYYMALLNGESGSTGGELIGVVADSDIYNGARLVGATVWIEGTSYTDTADADGYYVFDDVPYGTYRIWASYPGYADGYCDATLEASQKWCSIALLPATTGGDDTGGGDTDVPGDTAPPADTGVGQGPDDGPDVAIPGNRVRMDEVDGGCGCDAGAGGAAWLGLAAIGMVARRRRAG